MPLIHNFALWVAAPKVFEDSRGNTQAHPLISLLQFCPRSPILRQGQNEVVPAADADQQPQARHA